jgi:hypothetical protein
MRLCNKQQRVNNLTRLTPQAGQQQQHASHDDHDSRPPSNYLNRVFFSLFIFY